MKSTLVIAFLAIAVTISPGGVVAQGIRDIAAPAERPPGSFAGREYVDSAGCVFVRAAVDGVVTWVPRVTRARQPICNGQPSLATARAPEPAGQAAPAQTIPQPPAATRAPVDNTPALTAAPAQRATAPSAVPAKRSRTKRVVQPGSRPAPQQTTRPAVQTQAPAARAVIVHDGYERVWMEGRLGGNGTHRTFAEQAQIDVRWSQSAVRPAHPVPANIYVQAGVFAGPAQAEASGSRLLQIGLNARLGSMTYRGARYSLLLSGPFASTRAAQAALAQVRAAGFANARLR